MYTVIGTVRTRAARVLWMLEELGLPYTHVAAGPRSDGVTPFNPAGKVPVLIADHVPITDSTAILTFLADRHGTCVDAPLDASGILGTIGHVIRCGRVSGLEDAAFHMPRACMEICRSGPVRLPALDGAPSGMLVCPTRSLDRMPLRFLAPSHIRRHPDDNGLCVRHRRFPVIFALAQERPGCSCHAVG